MAPRLTLRLRRHILDVDTSLPLDAQAPVTVLFGPSGAGKTTLLRCVAGLERPDPGSRVRFGEEEWEGPAVRVPARERRIGYLFQDHALFPHMDVTANVAYGLHRLGRGERATRAAEALAATGATHLAGRPTRLLSGGEGQRVALARALAPRPRLLLLDEPLSALDTPTRVRLRAELRSILLAQGTPAIVVTHDRGEALALGDRIVVLIEGRAHQDGPVETVFSRPVNPRVAAALGVENILPGRVVELAEGLVDVRVGEHTLTAPDPGGLVEGAEVLACVRAEEIAVHPGPPDPAAGPRNHLVATVTAITPEGPLRRVELDARPALTAAITLPDREERALAPGRRVTAAIKVPALHLVPHEHAAS